MSIYATVFLDRVAQSIDREYEYIVPAQFLNQLQVGMRVLVPFGNSNRITEAIVSRVSGKSSFDKHKHILTLLDEKPILDQEMMRLAAWMKDKYFCRFYDAVKTILPSGMDVMLKKKYAFNFSAHTDVNLQAFCGLSSKRIELLKYLQNTGHAVTFLRLCDIFGPEIKSDLDALTEAGLLTVTQEKKRRVKELRQYFAKLLLSEEQLADILPNLERFAPRQAAVISVLQEASPLPASEICATTLASYATLSALAKKGYIQVEEQVVSRSPIQNASKSDNINAKRVQLNTDQKKAYQSILAQIQSGDPAGVLLFGVTGSGKTEVMANLISSVLDSGKSIILLLPEIALTPQAIAVYSARFGDTVALLHSGLSEGERTDEWIRISNGAARIVIGTRSAVFAPVKNLGLIVMDEEQEYSYKSEITPKYHARDIARFRCAFHSCVLLMASATPSLKTYYHTQTGRYQIATLPKRHSGISLPEVVIADMRKEMEKGSSSVFSEVLLQNIDHALSNDNQTILFLNRRGYNTFISCKSCGYVSLCNRCSIPMTYHAEKGKLLCHYCGYMEMPRNRCPSCGSATVRYSGTGTQKIYEELQTLFPKSRILRMDADATSGKGAHKKLIGDFEKKRYQIMVGTQMVTKGLDFENVTLVGVLAADAALYSDDFRAGERSFSQLTQVIGRSGRGGKPGKAVIQTFSPEHPIIKYAVEQDYCAFYRDEIQFRKMMYYPPFSDVFSFLLSGKKEEEVIQAAAFVADQLKREIEQMAPSRPIQILGPAPAHRLKANDRYRHQVIAKCRDSRAFRDTFRNCQHAFSAVKKFQKVSLAIDNNPLII